jgi:hypothetical protein
LEEEPVEVLDGFTHGIGCWEKDRDLPIDPNNPGKEVLENLLRIPVKG